MKIENGALDGEYERGCSIVTDIKLPYMKKLAAFLVLSLFFVIPANAQTYEFSGMGIQSHGADTIRLTSCRFEFTEATCNPQIGKEPSLWVFFSDMNGKDRSLLSFYPSKESIWCSLRVSPRVYGLIECRNGGNSLLYMEDDVYPVIYLGNRNREHYVRFIILEEEKRKFSLFMTKLIIEAEKRGILSWKEVDQME